MTGPALEEFRERRLSLGLSIDEVAKKLGIEARLFSNVERGEHPLSASLRIRLQQILNLDAGNESPSGEGSNASHRPVPIPSPFKGLSPYSSQDAGRFFGREDFIRSVLTTLSYENSCLISGPSGVGKTSLVNAGVVAHLERKESPAIVSMRPGTDPMVGLAAAIWRAVVQKNQSVASRFGSPIEIQQQMLGPSFFPNLKQALGASRVVIVIDQMEELFRISRSAACNSFCVLLEQMLTWFGGTDAVQLLGTLRAEFLQKLAQHPNLSQVFSSTIHLVPPLANSAIRRIIREPLRKSDIDIDSRLVDTLASQIEKNQSALPLLSFCMDTLWDRRESNDIAYATYEALGGIEGLIRDIAEAEFALFPGTDRNLCKSAILEMVAFAPPGSTEPHTKKRYLLDQAPSESHHVIDRLVAARLLVTDEGDDGQFVEFAHEAIMHAWPRLAGWIEADGDVIRSLNGVRQAARVWFESRRSPSNLWTGLRLKEFHSLRLESVTRHLSSLEKEFVNACNELQAFEDRAQLLGLVRVLNSLPVGRWEAVAGELASLGPERLRQAYGSGYVTASFREQVVLVCAGVAPASLLAATWTDVPVADLQVSAHCLRESGVDTVSLVKVLAVAASTSAKALVGLTAIIAEAEGLGALVAEQELRFEMLDIAHILTPDDDTLSHNLSLIIAQAYPKVVDAYIHAVNGGEDPETFSRSFLLLKSLSRADPRIQAQVVAGVSLDFFNEMFSLDGISTASLSVLRSELEARSTVPNVATASSLATLGSPHCLAEILRSANHFDLASEFVSRSSTLSSEAVVKGLIGDISRSDVELVSASTAAGNLLQAVGILGRIENLASDIDMICSLSHRCPSAFVVSSAEWALRSLLRRHGKPDAPSEITDILDALPRSGNDHFRISIGDTSIRFIKCPAVTFNQGRPEGSGQLLYLDPETSVRVTLSEDYWLADRPVSRKVFAIASTALNIPPLPNISHVSPIDDCPVVAITWDEAASVSRWICDQIRACESDTRSGPRGGLPTESQWEAACRAGTSWSFSFGESDKLLPDFACYAPNSSNRTSPGGTRRPNLAGLFDMHGTCWEWCVDWFDVYQEGALTDPRGPSTGVTKVLRGGCWNLGSEWARSYCRNMHAPSNRNYYTSFRPVAPARASGVTQKV